jgi:hypothetical protein
MKSIVNAALFLGFALSASADKMEVRENRIYRAMADTANAAYYMGEVACGAIGAAAILQKDIPETVLTLLGRDTDLEWLGMVGANDACDDYNARQLACTTPAGRKYKVSGENHFFSRTATLTSSLAAGAGSVYLQYKLAVALVSLLGPVPMATFVAVPLAAYFINKGKQWADQRPEPSPLMDEKQALVSISQTCGDCTLKDNILKCDYCLNIRNERIWRHRLDISGCKPGTIENQNGFLSCER